MVEPDRRDDAEGQVIVGRDRVDHVVPGLIENLSLAPEVGAAQHAVPLVRGPLLDVDGLAGRLGSGGEHAVPDVALEDGHAAAEEDVFDPLRVPDDVWPAHC